MDIREQIKQLLQGEGRYLSVHEQWELAQSLKKLLAVYECIREPLHTKERPEPEHRTDEQMAIVQPILDALNPAPERQGVPDGQKFTKSVKKCIGNDPLCPCQDGDMCHYEGPDAWPIPDDAGRET